MFKKPASKFQIDSLDGLRGLAGLMVFLSHSSNQKLYFFPHANFSGIGKPGVVLFFVLSSFLLTTPFLHRSKDAINIKFLLNYFFRRFWRIYPLYFLYLCSALISTKFLWQVLDADFPIGIPFSISIADFWRQILLIKGLGITWSILVEFRYYLVLPLVGLTYSIVLKNRILPSAIFTFILILIARIQFPISEYTNGDIRLGIYLPIFLCGSLLSLIFYHWSKYSSHRKNQVALGAEISGAIALIILVLLTPSCSTLILGRTIPLDYFHKNFLLFSVLWCIVIFACVAGIGMIRNFFEIPCLRYLGFISFSMYLSHLILLEIIPDFPLKVWAAFVATIICSHLLWLLIEKPSAKVRLFQNKTSS